MYRGGSRIGLSRDSNDAIMVQGLQAYIQGRDFSSMDELNLFIENSGYLPRIQELFKTTEIYRSLVRKL